MERSDATERDGQEYQGEGDLNENYDGFGSGYDEHKKYLPCMAILERLSGDNSRLWRPLPFLKKLKE